MHAIELGSRLQLEHGNFGNYKGYDILVNDFNQGFSVYPIITFRFENTSFRLFFVIFADWMLLKTNCVK